MGIVNNKAYDWADIDIQIPGLVIEAQEISNDDELEKEVVYGTKQMPRGYGTGNYNGKLATYIEIMRLKPRWNGQSWIETATEEELEAVKPLPIDSSTVPPSTQELQEQNLLLMEATTELYEQDLQIKEEQLNTYMAITEIYEMIL